MKKKKVDMSFEDLADAISSVLPNAEFDENEEGQIIIYTNLKETEDGKLVEYVPED